MSQKFHIEENENNPDNIFLMSGKDAVGDARRQKDGKWAVTVSCLYDPETDTDCKLVGWASDVKQAAQMLMGEVAAVFEGLGL